MIKKNLISYLETIYRKEYYETFKFQRSFPYITNPFQCKKRNFFEGVRKETEWLIEQGVDGIGIAIASEVLNDIEKFDLLSAVVDQSAGRVPIL